MPLEISEIDEYLDKIAAAEKLAEAGGKLKAESVVNDGKRTVELTDFESENTIVSIYINSDDWNEFLAALAEFHKAREE